MTTPIAKFHALLVQMNAGATDADRRLCDILGYDRPDATYAGFAWVVARDVMAGVALDPMVLDAAADHVERMADRAEGAEMALRSIDAATAVVAGNAVAVLRQASQAMNMARREARIAETLDGMTARLARADMGAAMNILTEED